MKFENGDKVKLHECIAVLQSEMKEVKEQVSNHIPSVIKEVRNEAIALGERVNKKLNWLFVLFVTSLLALILDLLKDKVI